MDVKINVTRTFVVNGKEYHSLEEIPAEMRQAVRGATGSLSVEGGVSCKINFNGRVYSSPDEMPPEARQLYEKALSMAKLGGSEGVTSRQYVTGSITPRKPTESNTAGRLVLLVGAAVILLYLLYSLYLVTP